MTEQEKELLLKDITARLSYGLKVQIDFGEHCIKYGIDRYVDDTVICVWPETFEIGVNDEDQACDIEDVKPYLRPMSSMTEEEAEEMFHILHPNNKLLKIELEQDMVKFNHLVDGKCFGVLVCFFNKIYSLEQLDWLNAHHFDYRDLIEKGLALEAPEGMYQIATNK